jgi:hypothetical protein
MATFGGRIARLVAVVLGLPLAYAGCAARQPPPVGTLTNFKETEHKPYMASGGNSIMGKGFVWFQQQGGDLVTCAGRAVWIMPNTSFFHARIYYVRDGKIAELESEIPPAFNGIIRKTQCDKEGNFSYAALPSGEWLVFTNVEWVIGSGKQGGALMRSVTLLNNQTVQVLLTYEDFIGP